MKAFKISTTSTAAWASWGCVCSSGASVTMLMVTSGQGQEDAPGHFSVCLI